MTTKQIVESIKLTNPTVPQQKVILDLSDAQELFIEETGLTETSANLTLDTGLTYAVPTGALYIRRIEFYDSSTDPLDLLGYEIKGGSIFFTVLDDPTSDTMPSEVETITVYYVPEPTALSTVDSALAIPERYAPALMARLRQVYSAEAGDLNSAQYWEREYMRYTKRGKQQARNRMNEIGY